MTYVVLFDLDGTLVDSPRAIVETFTAAFESMGIGAKDPAAIRATIGLPLEQAFAKLLGVAPDDVMVSLGVQRYLALFKEIILPRAAELLFPGVVAGLETLRAQGFTLTIATSKFHASADALLTAAGIRDQFAMVVGADQVTHPKPHPETGLVILAEFGVPAGDAVMVGDTTHDLLMAKAAGVHAIAVTYGVHSAAELASAEPARTAGTFGDVVKHIKELAQDKEIAR
ncbi:HAD family hydrolase [Amycolatopsis sp.]|jgi:HAD superfamily hydrolase (TIGR01509 family)|uniref:HAD family hydrolase n=1 Tax=Amycolatopsis sp. TaxID=37632 RepID=UPI002E0628C0|nr:HAD family hydrolase [Amycolatopsis sp.]